MKDERFEQAVVSLKGNPNWSVLIDYLKHKRDGWMFDAGDAVVVRDHAALAAVTARMDELNQLLNELESATNLDD